MAHGAVIADNANREGPAGPGLARMIKGLDVSFAVLRVIPFLILFKAACPGHVVFGGHPKNSGHFRRAERTPIRVAIPNPMAKTGELRGVAVALVGDLQLCFILQPFGDIAGDANIAGKRAVLVKLRIRIALSIAFGAVRVGVDDDQVFDDLVIFHQAADGPPIAGAGRAGRHFPRFEANELGSIGGAGGPATDH